MEVDFFKTPYFLFKSNKKIVEKISEEIEDILKQKTNIDYRNYKSPIKVSDKNKSSTPIRDLSIGKDFNIQTSSGGFTDNDGSKIKLENISSQIQNHIKDNIKTLPFSIKYLDVWFNITPNNDYNRCHNHKDQSDLVFVLYLTKGTLWIQNPNYRLKIDRYYNKVGSSISLDFNIGDMIVFPSDIHHWVEPFHENYDRITIAGNLSIN